ncbi:MAG TPA: hypothetical protein ENH06_02065 [bacterium]|nr:hypothetical protein [bacterium]
MINLLPPKYKEELKLEERLKILLILSILFFSFLISLTLILFSIHIYIQGEIEAQKIIIKNQEEQSEIFENQKIEQEISLINETILNLNSFYKNQFNFTKTLEKISKNILPGIYLTNISINPIIKENGTLQVSISGFAPFRETLFKFKKNLEKVPEFKELYFPPSNWIDPVNINFNISFKIE